MTTLTAWDDVRIWDFDGNEVADDQRIELLREYRSTNGIIGHWLADPAETDADNLAEAGPAVDQIDWTGFPTQKSLSSS